MFPLPFGNCLTTHAHHGGELLLGDAPTSTQRFQIASECHSRPPLDSMASMNRRPYEMINVLARVARPRRNAQPTSGCFYAQPRIAEVAYGIHRTGAQSRRIVHPSGGGSRSGSRQEAEAALGAGRGMTVKLINGLLESGQPEKPVKHARRGTTWRDRGHRLTPIPPALFNHHHRLRPAASKCQGRPAPRRLRPMPDRH